LPTQGSSDYNLPLVLPGCWESIPKLFSDSYLGLPWGIAFRPLFAPIIPLAAHKFTPGLPPILSARTATLASRDRPYVEGLAISAWFAGNAAGNLIGWAEEAFKMNWWHCMRKARAVSIRRVVFKLSRFSRRVGQQKSWVENSSNASNERRF